MSMLKLKFVNYELCEEGAKDVNNIWVPVIIRVRSRHCLTKLDCNFSHGLSFNNFINQTSGFQTLEERLKGISRLTIKDDVFESFAF